MTQITPEQALKVAHELHAAGRLEEAVALLRRAIVIRPTVEGFLTLAFLLDEMGRADEAAAAYQAGLRINPKNAAAQNNLGELLNRLGRAAEAEAACRAAIALQPNLLAPYNNLGNALRAQRRIEEAADAYRAALRIDPNFADAHLNLGYALLDLARLSEAADAFAAAAKAHADPVRALNSLGVTLARLHRHAEAEAVLRDVIARDPNYGGHYNNLGNVLCDAGRFEEAVQMLRRAIELTPEDAQAWSNLGNALVATGALDSAVDAYREAIARVPDFGEAYNNLGHALKDTLRQREAVDAYREASRLRPRSPELASNLLYGLHFLPHLDAQAIFQEHRTYGQRAVPAEAAYTHAPIDRSAGRPLRVGFVSGDLREHPVGRFMLPIFRHHDREQFQFICFSQWRSDDNNNDAVTRMLRAGAAGWHDIVGLSDYDAADLVRAQQIDILIDLAGHTAHNRLNLFALNPAPVQASYLGYPNTTGLPTIEYRFTDALADPPGEADALHIERLVRLPESAWCYEPPDDAPDVAPPPCAAAGHITFGSFNNFAKVNESLIALWSKVLLAVDGSRLLLKTASLRDPATRMRAHDAFAAHGVAAERVELIGMTATPREHLDLYRRVDVALDTFPYHGTTTTCEALWMGVPVVTMAGRTHASRVGVSLLTSMGLTDLIADDEEGYIAAAARLAGDRTTLAQIRATLRERMRRSPLMGGVRFTRAWESALRAMTGA